MRSRHSRLLYIALLVAALAQAQANDGLVSASQQQQQLQQQQQQLGLRAISAVMGESAVVDNESGRILWEGGSSSTLAESIAPKLQNVLGIPHLKASILTALLCLAAAGTIAQAVRDLLTTVYGDVSRPFFHAALFAFTQRLLSLPRLPQWLVIASTILYFAEAYCCSTRRYLSHPVSNVEGYIEQLRQQSPVVEWKVRSYHYEHSLASLVNTLLWSLWKREPLATRPSHLRWKRISHTARNAYHYASCRDRTIAGVWKRAAVLPRHRQRRRQARVPLTKISLTKTLLLRDAAARRNYFDQQRAFVMKEHTDDYAEFSTRIHIEGYHARVLAAPSGMRPFWCSLVVFWMFTCLGLTVPYRRFLMSRCDEVKVRLIKETGTDNNTSASGWLFAPKKVDKDSSRHLANEGSSFRSMMQMLYDSIVDASTAEQPTGDTTAT